MGVAEADAKKISVLKSITTTAKCPSWEMKKKQKAEEDDDELLPVTPKGMKIPKILRCPPAPRKRKPSNRRRFNINIEAAIATTKLFIPPDLDTVFLKRSVV